MFGFCREEENGRKLGNGKRGCVAYIYTLSNAPTPFPAIPPGGWVAQRMALRCWPIFYPARGLIAQAGQHHQRHNSHCIYTPIVHGWNTPIAIILEMFVLSGLHMQFPNISEKTNATKSTFCGVHYFPAFLPRGSSPPNWILIFVGLAVPTSLSV